MANMASLSSQLTSFASLLIVLTLLAICSSHVRAEHGSHHKVSIQSLMPSKVCSSFTATDSAASSTDVTRLRVAHRNGPCSPLRPRPALSHEQILEEDAARVVFLRRRISAASSSSSSSSSASTKYKLDEIEEKSSSTTPARSGKYLGTGNYVVTVGFGTPKRSQTVFFDTGSDVTWIQCQPCAGSCYQQQEPLFDPTQSSTYANISCSSSYCDDLDISGCSSSTCLYQVQYGDNSYTIGFFAKDTLTISPSDVIPKFRFGCGENNGGLFGQAAGLMGLGRGTTSLVMQTYQKYGGVFSYCLPSSPSSTGYLAFGHPTSASSNIKFTPMLTDSSEPSFYYLSLTAITVGGQRLPIPAAVFSDAGTIIDSGTVITRLPPTAYSALRAAFRRGMSGYKKASALSILDTCYDFTGHSSVSVPTVALQFGKGATSSVNLDPSGILYYGNQSQVCLAFAANGDDSDLAILGNTQQKTFNIVYDVSKKAIGFGAGGCS